LTAHYRAVIAQGLMLRAARWLIVAPVVLFVFATLIESCGGSSGCSGSFNSSGIYVSGACPTSQASPGFGLQSIVICQGTEPAPTPTPSPAPSPTKKQPTPTPTACPAATSTSVPVGEQVGFTAQGFLTKKKQFMYEDITNAAGTLWTTTAQNVLQPPILGQGGIYTGASDGCACITANAGGISSLPVGITVGSPVSACPECPTPTPSATPTAAAAQSAAPAVLSTPGSTSGGVYSWMFDAHSPVRGSIVPGPDGRVYFITADSMLHAVNSHGIEVFDRPAGGHAPAVDTDGTVFVQGTTTWLYALAPDGQPIWQVDMKAAADPVAASDGTAYVSIGSEIAAVTSPGQVTWRVPYGPATAGVPIAGGVVVAESGDRITALSSSGGRLWTFSPAGGFSGALAVSGSAIFAGSRSGTLYALNAQNGSELWEADSPAPVIAGPVVTASGTVAFGSDKLYVLNPSGTSMWSAGAPIAFGLTDDSAGGALDALQDGTIELFDTMGGVVTSTRSIANAVLTGYSPIGLSYVATSDGRLYAIK
jgi:outer membrane protein assembly factor BamB